MLPLKYRYNTICEHSEAPVFFVRTDPECVSQTTPRVPSLHDQSPSASSLEIFQTSRDFYVDYILQAATVHFLHY